MIVGYLQFTPVFGQVKKNIEAVIKLIEKEETAIDLLVLPELFSTGYFFTTQEELFELAEDFEDSSTIKLLCGIADKKKVHLVAGIAEKKGEHFYNSAVLITPTKGLTAAYRKVHLFNEEKFFFQAGNVPFQVHQTTQARIGMLVCFDWAFPEAARVLALEGAQILCHPANLVLPYCQKTMIGRCIENRVFAVTANRTGRDVKGDRSLDFKGQSQIVDTKGNVLVASDQTSAEIKTVCLNPEDADNKNITPNNHLFKDRRVDFYQDLFGR